MAVHRRYEIRKRKCSNKTQDKGPIKVLVMQQRSWKLKHATDVDCVENVTRQLNIFDQNDQYWQKIMFV